MHFATAKSTWADLVSSLIYKLAACVVAKKARYLCIDPLLYLPEQMAVSATNSNWNIGDVTIFMHTLQSFGA